MQIKLDLTITEIEMANFILQQGVKNAKESPYFKKHFKVTDQAIDEAERFREKLLEAYLKDPDKVEREKLMSL